MKLYLATIQSRRKTGYGVRFEWDTTRLMTQVHRGTLRGRYRVLREHGIGPMQARFIIWDLVDAGRKAERKQDHRIELPA